MLLSSPRYRQLTWLHRLKVFAPEIGNLVSLLRLATLMRVWSGDIPLPLLQDKPHAEYSERDTGVLEDAVARFYTDTFFIFFGRAAVIPTRLP